MSSTAMVAVSDATLYFDKLYTYKIPVHMQDNTYIGSMVLVPFGKGKGKPRMGVVLSLGEEDNYTVSKIKSIYDVAPESAKLSQELFDIVSYLKNSTFCTYYDAVKAVIPYGARYKSVSTQTGYKLQKKIIRHTENYYKCLNFSEKFTEKQKLVWEKLQLGDLSQSEFEEFGITTNILNRMCDKGFIEKLQRDVTLPIYENYTQANKDISLSPHQQKVFDDLNNKRQQNKASVSLLHGVTSSGKTIVFLRLVQETIKSGRQALILVPEISLTAQMIYTLKSYFGNSVAVQHSALSNTERLIQYNQIQNGKANVVVGTRSAIFAPLQNIGIIIIDEEQEHTYYSESSPRYSAHNIAKKRALTHKAMLLLASATPSVNSYYNAMQKKYSLVTISKRFNEMPLPGVKFVDMRSELAMGNAGALSGELVTELENIITDKKQAILLLNRRGYKTIGMCTSCSTALKCSSCSVPMVYHKQANKLLCHYCSRFISPVPSVCPDCGGKLNYTGFGTQRVQEELEEKLPGVRVLRMDADSTQRKNSHEKMLAKFRKGDYDVMLGTHMVAKGLDFEKVTLVGVLGIDQMLFAQGYKAFETAFSLITQVVGRSGRANAAGRAIIQTVDVEHPILKLAAKQDYISFYKQEIKFRKLNLYPPYCTICTVGFTGEDQHSVFNSAVVFGDIIKKETIKNKNLPIRVLGPAPMNVVFINNKYRYKLTVKCRNNDQFRKMLHSCILKYNNSEIQKKAGIFIDMNSFSEV